MNCRSNSEGLLGSPAKRNASRPVPLFFGRGSKATDFMYRSALNRLDFPAPFAPYRTAVRSTRSLEAGIGTACSSCRPDKRLLATSEKVSSDENERKLETEKETIINASVTISH